MYYYIEMWVPKVVLITLESSIDLKRIPTIAPRPGIVSHIFRIQISNLVENTYVDI